jgi:hypothetical protein
MKKLLLAVTALVLTTGIFAQKKSTEVAKFASETVDLGKIKQDIPTTAVFEVTNIGTEPLIIEQATPTCGCTIGDYTKEPIAPGKVGYIKATYNAKNIGMFEKRLNVKFAGYDMQNITIKGEVIKNEAAAQTATDPASAPAQAVVAEPVKEVMIDNKNTKSASPSKTNPAKKASPSKTTNLNKKP